MNRIILIGNGFDRTHGLPTSYESFINSLWQSIYKDIRDKSNSTNFSENDYISVGVRDKFRTLNSLLSVVDSNRTYKEIIQILSNPEFSLNYKNQFLKIICSHCQDKGWHGIEHDYYQELKNFERSPSLHSRAEDFNNQFSKIKEDLRQYLIDVEKKKEISDDIIKEEIKRKIFSPFRVNEVSGNLIKKLLEPLANSLNELFQDYDKNPNKNTEQLVTIRLKDTFPHLDFKDPEYCIENDIFSTFDRWRKVSIHQIYYDLGINPKYRKMISSLLFPNEILFLDFNYTNTTEQYRKSDTDIIHIHGELNNPKNPMIFGYGDEIGEDYKKIEDLEENELLKNVKSIRYQDTNNYQKLMEFIESDYYQVFVMGHSCGNSDRTLLNTLFEHDNCVSIKPFYYIDEKGFDNYSDIVRNISRNFRDKPSMRNKVVNKTYCELLLGDKPK